MILGTIIGSSNKPSKFPKSKNLKSIPRKMPPNRNRKSSESPGAGDAMADCVLSEDLMLCIFTRLPVKSVQRFKSVCKPLRHVLSSPEFAKMHRAQFHVNPDDNPSVIIWNRPDKSIDHTTISLLKIDSDVEKKPIHISPQVYYFAEVVEFIGCCNGLICMSFLGKQIALWNPALNMSICLPIPEIEIDSHSLESIGFGYNEEADDFKVIIIENTSAAVYSCNSNSWSTIDLGFRFSAVLPTNNAIVNGCPYWYVWVDLDLVLLCFDVRKMVFKIMPLPDLIFEELEFSDMLFVNWKGDLGAIMCSKENDERVLTLDVWVFDDVGKIGWTKKCSFGSTELSALNADGSMVACVKNGKFLIGDRLEDGSPFVFDTENGKVVVDEVGNEWWSSYVCGDYIESLTYIKGMERKTRIVDFDRNQT
ncbi:hypothetical protein CASFOL_027764 [Castilleja foliolosa]|uniref:F-box domain-containing protein n=1 Tax=Castilleja foliolosa TaxID=1961234 RepID=A0ABD3CFR4_9LAMI